MVIWESSNRCSNCPTGPDCPTGLGLAGALQGLWKPKGAWGGSRKNSMDAERGRAVCGCRKGAIKTFVTRKANCGARKHLWPVRPIPTHGTNWNPFPSHQFISFHIISFHHILSFFISLYIIFSYPLIFPYPIIYFHIISYHIPSFFTKNIKFRVILYIFQIDVPTRGRGMGCSGTFLDSQNKLIWKEALRTIFMHFSKNPAIFCLSANERDIPTCFVKTILLFSCHVLGHFRVMFGWLWSHVRIILGSF